MNYLDKKLNYSYYYLYYLQLKNVEIYTIFGLVSTKSNKYFDLFFIIYVDETIVKLQNYLMTFNKTAVVITAIYLFFN